MSTSGDDLTQPASTRTPSHRERTVLAALHRANFVLLLCLWGLATLYLGGDLGKYLDDYSLCKRDPVTGNHECPVPYWRVVHAFYRPLHLTVVLNVQTLLWEQGRLPHVLSALAHLLVVVLLWRLLSGIVRSPHVAWAAAVLFMVFPLHYEAIFWSAAIGGILGTATFLALALLYMRLLDAERWWPGMILAALLAFTIPCWYEQAATGILALPLLAMAPLQGKAATLTRFRRSLLIVLACVAACALYIVLMLASMPPGSRGSSGSLVSASDVPQRLHTITASIGHAYSSVAGAILQGGCILAWQSLTPVRASVWACLIVACLLYWWPRWRAAAVPENSLIQRSSIRHGLSILAGLAIFVLAWLPVGVVREHILEPRMYYYPTIGLIISLASMFDAVLMRWCQQGRRHRSTIALIGIVASVAGLLGGLSLAGAQQMFQARSRLDDSEMVQLRELVPSPPPETYFVPLSVENRPARTGVAVFDSLAMGALSTPWSAQAIVQATYHRGDVFTTCCNWWMPGPPIEQPDRSGFRYRIQDKRIAWPQSLPFVIDRHGRVHLVDRIRWGQAGDDGVELPHVRAILQQRALPGRTFDFKPG